MPQPKHMMDEADIGSGEKHSSDHDTEEEIRKIKRLDKDRLLIDIKEEEKLKGLVDEDHPFPSKGN